MTEQPARLSGRRAEAARNDGKILDAAREVFLADPWSPIAAVAARAGVGISALYRRYSSKETLLQALAEDGLTRFIADLELALADDGDVWTAYSDCLHRVLAGGSQALAQRLAGTFPPTDELIELSTRAGHLYAQLHERTRSAGALRSDVSTADVVLLLEMVTLVDVPGAEHQVNLQHRYLSLLLQALALTTADPLPGVAATDADLAARWTPEE